MPKTLKDIITPERAGRNIPKGEEDFLDAHKVAETDYPVKQKGDTHKASTEHKPDSKHGYTKPKESEKVYKATNEEKHYFHVTFPSDDTRDHRMIDPENERGMSDVSEPIGNKPKGHRLKITLKAQNRTDATKKAARYVGKNYGSDVKFTYGGKIEEANEEKKYKRSKRSESPESPGSPGLTLPMSNTRV
jgi:hypothetical protein